MLKKLFDLNQVAKNLNPDSVYLYRNGKVFSHSRYGGIAYIDNVYLDIFETDKLYKIDGKAIYDMLKVKSTPKKSKYSIEYNGDIDIFPELFEESKAICMTIKCIHENDKIYNDYMRIMTFISKYKDTEQYVEITEQFTKFIADKGIRLDVGDEYKITLVKNFMVSYGKTDKIFMNVSEPITGDNGVTYITTIKQIKPKMEVFIKVLCVKM